MKNRKSYLLGLLTGAIIFGSIGVLSATLLTANDVSYSREGTTIETAKDAIDNLFEEVDNGNHVWNRINNDSDLNEMGINNINNYDSFKNVLTSFSRINNVESIVTVNSNSVTATTAEVGKYYLLYSGGVTYNTSQPSSVNVSISGAEILWQGGGLNGQEVQTYWWIYGVSAVVKATSTTLSFSVDGGHNVRAKSAIVEIG